MTQKPKRPRYLTAELLAEAEAAGVYPLPPEEREWIDSPAVGRELLANDADDVRPRPAPPTRRRAG